MTKQAGSPHLLLLPATKTVLSSSCRPHIADTLCDER